MASIALAPMEVAGSPPPGDPREARTPEALLARRQALRSHAAPAGTRAPVHTGALCKRGHAWGTTGQSLRRNNSAGDCATCDTIRHREAKARAKPKRKAPRP
jgi:hypothetical protein